MPSLKEALNHSELFAASRMEKILANAFKTKERFYDDLARKIRANASSEDLLDTLRDHEEAWKEHGL